MDLLKNIIDQHFLSLDKEEINILFEKHNLSDLISKHAAELKNLIEANNSNNKAPLPILSAHTTNLLIGVNLKVAQILDETEKRKIQQAVANISVRIFATIIKNFPSEAAEVVKVVKEALKTTAKLWGYDYHEIEQLMNIKEFDEMINSISGENSAKQIKRIPKNSFPYLKWTDKCNIGLLTSDLKAKEWIKTQNEFAKLFNNVDINLKVRWNPSYKYELARLLFVLVEKDFVRPVSMKGYFVIAERHIVNYMNDPLPKNFLKKASSKMTKEPQKYKDIIDEVDQLIHKLKIV